MVPPLDAVFILLTAGGVSLLTSLAGISGAFLLLPFQVSVLGIISPTASATNHLFNVLAIPGGVMRFIRQGRMAWGLAGLLALGSLPGAVLGAWMRVEFLADIQSFRRFVGAVLALVALRFLFDLVRKKTATPPVHARVTPLTGAGMGFAFAGADYPLRPLVMGGLALLVGCVGGIYGIGGGSLMAPLMVGWFRLPVQAIAGATLSATWITSLVSALTFTLLAPHYPLLAVMPDWGLGLLLGLGGALGIALGARLQPHLPTRWIHWGVFFTLAAIAARYLA